LAPYDDYPNVCYKYISSEFAFGLEQAVAVSKQEWSDWAVQNNVAEIYVRGDPSDYAIVRYIGYDCSNVMDQSAPGLGFERIPLNYLL
jgi:hypothetical protein